jgi:hypothetical protein
LRSPPRSPSASDRRSNTHPLAIDVAKEPATAGARPVGLLRRVHQGREPDPLVAGRVGGVCAIDDLDSLVGREVVDDDEDVEVAVLVRFAARVGAKDGDPSFSRTPNRSRNARAKRLRASAAAGEREAIMALR